MVHKNRLYTIVDDEELHEVFTMLHGKVKIPGMNMLAGDIKQAHGMMKEKLIELFKVCLSWPSKVPGLLLMPRFVLDNHLGKVHLLLNAWTSRSTSSYLGLVVQWCPDGSDKITKLTLQHMVHATVQFIILILRPLATGFQGVTQVNTSWKRSTKS